VRRHAHDLNAAQVFRIDGFDVWRAPARPAALVTLDTAQNWQRLDHGLPKEPAW